MPAPFETKFETNRNDVQNNIRSGGWVVAFSNRELTETDAAWGVISAVLSYFTGGAAFDAWLSDLINESLVGMEESIRDTFSENTRQEAIQFSDDVITNLLQLKNVGEQIHDFFQYDFKAGVTQYIGQNFTWIPNFSPEGGFWQFVPPNQISYCPYVGLRYNKSTGLTKPGHRVQWVGDNEVWYNNHSSGEWHQFNGLQNPQFIRVFQETRRDDNYVYLQGQPIPPGTKILELALGPDKMYYHYIDGDPGWHPDIQGHWRA